MPAISRGEMQAAMLAVMMLASHAASASADAPKVAVTKADGRYHLSAEMQIAAPAAAVYRRLTDYANLAALNPAIKRSDRRPAKPPFDARVATIIEACVPVYCRTLRRVEDVREGQGRLVAEIVPELSDFRFGRTEWRLQPIADGVRVRYRAELEPDFVVPPVVGTAFVKQGIVRELRTLLENLERLAKAGP